MCFLIQTSFLKQKHFSNDIMTYKLLSGIYWLVAGRQHSDLDDTYASIAVAVNQKLNYAEILSLKSM